MMRDTNIVVRVVRATLYRGERQAIGTTLRVAAADAAQLIECGKAELAHAGDAAAVEAARRHSVLAALRQAARPVHLPGHGTGWQSL